MDAKYTPKGWIDNHGDKLDNRLENLELIEYGEHTTLHCAGNTHSEETKRTQVLFRQMYWEIKRLRETNRDMYEALKKCVAIFQQLSDEGNYPHMLLAEEGGSGWNFASAALNKADKGE